MEPIQGWDDVPAKSFQDQGPTAGGYVLGIIKAEEKPSRKGMNMLVLQLDIAEGKYKNYYRDLSKRLNKDLYLTNYRLTEGDHIAYFKGDILAIEHSNAGYKFDFQPSSLVRKLVGANLREEEYQNKKGQNRLGLKICYFCSADDARKGLPLLKPKMLEKHRGADGFDYSAAGQTPPDEDFPF